MADFPFFGLIPTTPRPRGIVMGQTNYIRLCAGGCFHHPIILFFLCCQQERVLELEVLAQKETGVSMQEELYRLVCERPPRSPVAERQPWEMQGWN